jgi:hypothetical protein
MELTDETPVPTFRSSGLSQKEFCREHNVSLIKLQYHLYRKKKNSTNVKNRFSAKAGPSFITFEKPVQKELNRIEEKGGAITIIHGRFTPKELAAMLLELERTC